MNAKYFLLAIVTMMTLIFLSSCGKEDTMMTDNIIQNDLLTQKLENAPLAEDATIETQTLAVIKKEGHELYFEAIGKEDVLIKEKIPFSDEPTSLLDDFSDESTVFDIFVALTPAEVPVPQKIAKTTTTAIVTASNRTIDASNTLYEMTDQQSEDINTVEDRGCYDEGKNGFRSNRCGYTSSTPNNIRYCDPQTWTTHQRNSVYDGSWRTCKNVNTWTNVVCGITTMRFEQFVGGEWKLYYSNQMPNGIYRFYYKTSSSKYRRVKRTASGGSFRAFTQFYN